jgi:hypothetical protein
MAHLEELQYPAGLYDVFKNLAKRVDALLDSSIIAAQQVVEISRFYYHEALSSFGKNESCEAPPFREVVLCLECLDVAKSRVLRHDSGIMLQCLENQAPEDVAETWYCQAACRERQIRKHGKCR